MADRPAFDDFVADDLPAWSPGDFASDDEGHRTRVSQNLMEKELDIIEEKPDSFWNRVYLAVVITTIFVIAALWAFTEYFS